MAITAANRGSGGDNTAGTSFVITPASNFGTEADVFGILVLAYDNAGASGADPYSSITDSVGNTWTSRQAALYDPGAASAGVALRIFTSPLATGKLTTSNTITVSFGATSVTAKAYTLMQASSDAASPANNAIVYVTGGVNTGAATGTPTVTTSSIANGNLVIGAGGAESANTWVADADTTNGSWQSQTGGIGTGATGMSVISQRKIVTASGAQTFNPTLTSADCILAWIELKESLTRPAPFISSNTTLYAPSVALQVSAPAISITPTLYAPTINTGTTVTAPTISITPTLTAPQVNLSVTAPTISITPTLNAPSVTREVDPPAISITPTLYAPSISLQVSAPAIASSTTVYAPATTFKVYAPTFSITPTLNAPSVSFSVAAGTITVTPTLYAPTVRTTQVYAPVISITPTLNAPAVTLTVNAPTIASSTTLYAPTVTTSGSVGTPLISITPTLYAPSVSRSVAAPTISSSPTLYAPATSRQVAAPLITVSPILYAPAVSRAVTAPTISVTATLYAPAVIRPITVTVPAITVTAVLYAPTVILPESLNRLKPRHSRPRGGKSSQFVNQGKLMR